MAEKLENEARHAATKAATKRDASTHACSEEEASADHDSDEGGDKAQGSKAKRARAE